MPKFKPKSTLSSLKDLGKVAKEILPKEKRPRIKIQKETPKVVERVNYIPPARRSWSFEDNTNKEFADKLWNDMENKAQESLALKNNFGINDGLSDVLTVPVRRKIYGFATKGLYGPANGVYKPGAIKRNVLPEVQAIPDYFSRREPHALWRSADNDFHNAGITGTLIDIEGSKKAPRLPFQFLGSGMNTLDKIWNKPMRMPQSPMDVQPLIGGAQSYVDKFPGRPITTVQTDSERFYWPKYFDEDGNVVRGVLRSSYDTNVPESFEDTYRRLNNNQTIKLLDDPNDFKFGGILKKIK